MQNYDLQQLTKMFLEQNDLTIAFMARKTGISFTSLREWLTYSRNLNNAKIEKVKKFIGGSFITPISELINGDD